MQFKKVLSLNDMCHKKATRILYVPHIPVSHEVETRFEAILVSLNTFMILNCLDTSLPFKLYLQTFVCAYVQLQRCDYIGLIGLIGKLNVQDAQIRYRDATLSPSIISMACPLHN